MMIRAVRLLVLALVLVPAVAGCGAKPKVRFPTPPADKLVCPEEPGLPDDPITDKKNADYLKALRGWGGACKADVDWLRAWHRALDR